MQKHKILALLVAIPVALILWIYVITTVTPEMTKTVYNIPVSLDGVIALEERGLMITGGDNARVSLELEGNRVSVSKLASDNIRVVADVSRISEAGEYNLTYNISYPELSSNSQINVLRRSPTTIAITVTPVISKTVPVVFQWEGTVPEGCLFDAESVEFDFDQITVTGPDYAVEPITEAEIRYDVSELTETVVDQRPYTLRTEEGTEVPLSNFMSVNVESISVTLPIQRYKDVTLQVELIAGGGAAESNATVELTPPTIRVTGSATAINELEDIWVVGSINLAEVFNSLKREFPLTLPAGLTNHSGVTSVEAQVKIVGLSRMSFTISQITLENIPEGRKAELATQSVTVVLRGKSADMEKLTAEDITVTVDLTDYTQKGAFTVPAVVKVNGFTDIGLIGTVEVGVSLS